MVRVGVAPSARPAGTSTVRRPSGLDQRSAGTISPSSRISEMVNRVSSSTARRWIGWSTVKSSTATPSIALSSGRTLIDRSALSKRTASCSGVRGLSVSSVKAVGWRAGASWAVAGTDSMQARTAMLAARRLDPAISVYPRQNSGSSCTPAKAGVQMKKRSPGCGCSLIPADGVRDLDPGLRRGAGGDMRQRKRPVFPPASFRIRGPSGLRRRLVQPAWP